MIEISELDIQKILLSSSNSEKSFEKYVVMRLSEKPVGYLADHFILRIYEDSNNFTDFFLKAAPRGVQKRLEYLEETKFFTKEVQLYQNLIPILLKNSTISWAPESYLATDGHFIVMENLKSFKTFPSKNLTFDFDHLEVAAKTLACFHAASVIYEEKNGVNIGEEFKEMMNEVAYPKSPENHIRRNGLENAINVLSELMRLIPTIRDSTHYEEIMKRFPDTIRRIYEFSETSTKYRNVASHGDLWVNNLMFSYHHQDKPSSCKFVDFQLARYAPPSVDLADLVYINSSRIFRESQLNEILNTYCITIESALKKAKVSLKKLPRKEILESFKEYRLSGLINAALFGHLTLLPPTMSSSILSSSEEYDKFINQSRIKTCLIAFEEKYYRDRLSEILIEIVEVFISPEIIL